MRTLTALAVLLMSGSATPAMPAPVAPYYVLPAAGDNAIFLGPATATLESNYFRAPPAPVAVGKIFPCQMRLRAFDKTRLAAQNCN